MRDGLRITDVRLAHLQEPSPAREQAERRIDETARERVENDVHADAVRHLQKRLRKTRVTRGCDMRVVEPHRAQHGPLTRVRRREYLRSEMARKLHRRHADASGGRVDQDALAGLKRPQALQAEQRRQERHRDGRSLSRGQTHRDAHDHAVVGQGDRSARRPHQAHHPIPGA